MELIASHCTNLHSLALRQCITSAQCLHLLAAHCTKITRLNLLGVQCLTDSLLLSLALRLRALIDLDVSWNSGMSQKLVYVLC